MNAEHAHAPPVAETELRSELAIDAGRTRRLLGRIAFLGLLAAVVHACFAEQGQRRFLLAYVVAFAFVLSLLLGSLFVVCVTHLFRASWSVVLRRISEVLAANGLWVAVLFLPIAFSVLRGNGEVYPWAQPLSAATAPASDHAAPPTSPPQGDGGSTLHSDHGAHRGSPPPLDELTLRKRPYLAPLPFVIRWLILFGIWSFLGWIFWHRSVAQDASKDIRNTRQLEMLAAPTAVVFLLTLTCGAFDLLMSIDPHWYSTIFGIYYFAGCAVAGWSSLILLMLWLQNGRGLTAPIGREHRRDLGRLLFAFLFFWGYIAFSQFMLLWYANLPETTGWLAVRGLTTHAGSASAWTYVAIVLFLGHFLIPFAGLMSRHVKSKRRLLAFWAIWLLALHYVDLLWLVMPAFSEHLTLGLIEIGLLVSLVAFFLMTALKRAERASLVPLGDPRLQASLAHSEAY